MAPRTAELPAFPAKRTDPLGLPCEYATMREEAPVTRVRLEDGGAEAWLVTGYRQAREILGSKRFSSDATKPGFPTPERFRRAQQAGETFNRTLIRMDPPEHTRYRRMMSPEFMISRIEAMRPRIQEIADGLLDELARHTPPADLVQSFALPLPSLVICEVLGVPLAERPRFEGMSRSLVTAPSSNDPDRFVRVAREFRLYMEDLIARKRAAPGDDLLSRMIEWEAAGELTYDELVDMGRLLLLAGHITTANMIGLGVVLLLEHPDALAELRADPGLAASTVEEVLRHQTLIQGGLRRVAVEDAEVGGQLIRAGEGVIVLISAANRDARMGLGEDFDIHRGVRHHMAFGYGFHQCLGQLLARIELQTALVSVTQRFPNLALAVPLEKVAIRDDGFIHGVRELPVTW
jgi:cytochrome P450